MAPPCSPATPTSSSASGACKLRACSVQCIPGSTATLPPPLWRQSAIANFQTSPLPTNHNYACHLPHFVLAPLHFAAMSDSEEQPGLGAGDSEAFGEAGFAAGRGASGARATAEASATADRALTSQEEAAEHGRESTAKAHGHAEQASKEAERAAAATSETGEEMRKGGVVLKKQEEGITHGEDVVQPRVKVCLARPPVHRLRPRWDRSPCIPLAGSKRAR